MYQSGTHIGFDIITSRFDSQQTAGTHLSLSHLLIGEVLIIFATMLSSGCIHGHAVCGIPKFSLRSVYCLAAFMVSCAIAAFFKNKFNAGYVSEVAQDGAFMHFFNLAAKI